ncbi:MAG: DNA repair photolyase [Spirochaetaceae bacterium]
MSKISQFFDTKPWLRLGGINRLFITNVASEFRLSYQDIKQLIDISIDLESWDEEALEFYWPKAESELKDKALNAYMTGIVKETWLKLKNEPTDYQGFTPLSDYKKDDIKFVDIKEDRTILGDCPVASDKTRCCNLKTLDSVINCGYDCSYCTIQSFYKGGKILFEKNLKLKLDNLELDSNKRYHIGTGQSSDSLMWGNREDNLKHLFNFARENPNVILELKTKSNNIKYLLECQVPKNIICTWSLNTQTVIDNEEHLTSSLSERLEAAKQIHDKGILVGFHFHPMVYYTGWENEYKEIATKIMDNFNSQMVALISIGTLTFIKPVIKQIRSRNFKSKILQIPLADAEGKQSYTYDIKNKMFSFLYNSFDKWHRDVFFYMCMEDKKLWMDVFNREYSSNEEFEQDMLDSYFLKKGNL